MQIESYIVEHKLNSAATVWFDGCWWKIDIDMDKLHTRIAYSWYMSMLGAPHALHTHTYMWFLLLLLLPIKPHAIMDMFVVCWGHPDDRLGDYEFVVNKYDLAVFMCVNASVTMRAQSFVWSTGVHTNIIQTVDFVAISNECTFESSSRNRRFWQENKLLAVFNSPQYCMFGLTSVCMCNVHLEQGLMPNESCFDFATYQTRKIIIRLNMIHSGG